MASIEETAYPRLLEDIGPQELEQLYTPTPKERALINANSALRRPVARACAMVLLKVIQRLGYSIPLGSLPLAITGHVFRKLKVPRPSMKELARYDDSAQYTRHRQLALNALGLVDLDEEALDWIGQRSEVAAATKHELADIINVVLEDLVKHRYVLPGFTTLLRYAKTAREKVHKKIYADTTAALSDEQRERLDALMSSQGGKTDWDRLKREPKQPTKREVASFLQHIRWLGSHAEGLPDFSEVAATKLAQFTLEAQALDAAQMKALVPNKRYTLAALLVRSRLRKATDDVAEIYVKTLRRLDSDAERRLKEYYLEHTRQVERLIGQLLDVLIAYENQPLDMMRGTAISQALYDDPQQLIAECNEHMAYANNNYYPFMLRPYGSRRALLFECLDVLQPMPTYVDPAFGSVLGWVLENRNSHKELLKPVRKKDGSSIDTGWLPDKWRKLVQLKDNDGENLVHRKYLELAVFTRLLEELQSGDLYVPNSEQYDDYRQHFIDEAALRVELPQYTAMVEIPEDGASFVHQLRQELTELADQVDRDMPKNDSVAWGPNGLIIRKVEAKEPPPELKALDQAINDALGLHNIIDVLTETEQWLDLHKIFRPFSGYESKLEDPRARFIGAMPG